MTAENAGHPSFDAHVELLRLFLAHRDEIVERIQDVLNAQRKPSRYLEDLALLSRELDACFFSPAAIGTDKARLRGELEEAHWASGFRPRHVPELHNDLIHPAEMARRAFYCWQQTRWPGRNGRVRYAHTLFDVHLLRGLELLGMRVWDAGPDDVSRRLSVLQALLDELARTTPADRPVLVRDARWLIPLAQSPTTDELFGYFDVAERVASTLPDGDRLEVQKAHVLMIGGHLRSQIRHYCVQDRVPIDHESVVRRTRTSNALDFALLIQNLVPLLEAYEDARETGDDRTRLALADAICQGISVDPELFVLRIDLLGAYSMIEHLFVAAGPDDAEHTAMGRRHVGLLAQYAALIDRLSRALYDDCLGFRPVDGAYSPYGVFYGTPSNLTEHIAFKTITRDPVAHLGLEDVFTAGGADKLAWVNGWRQLPHVDPEVQRQHAYPQRFADEMFERIEAALRARASGEGVARTGRLVIAPDDTDSAGAAVPELPADYVGASDARVVAAGKARPYDEPRLLRDRQEGHFLVSYGTSGGWVAVRKDVLTDVLGAGRDVRISGLPRAAAAVLRLTCPTIAVADTAHASTPPSIVKA
ncbi:MAG TPA: hypothetical protein VF339_19580 [Gammaproteobacteria bacterium]